MTNEQLFILIEWMADSLEREVDTLRRDLTGIGGFERHPNLYKDGEYAGRVVDRAPCETWHNSGGSLERWATAQGYEVRCDGDLVMLAGLFRLVRRIRERSRALRSHSSRKQARR